VATRRQVFVAGVEDAFGNRTMEAYSTLSSTPCAPGANDNAQLTVTAQSSANNNQVAGITQYDPAGEVTYDGSNYYRYDGEGRLCAVDNLATGGVTQYIYDAGGARVAKGSLTSWPASCGAPGTNGFTLTSQYLLDLSGEQVTELNGAGTWQHSNAFEGGRLTATYDQNGLHFAIADPLGTKRVQAVITALNGAAQWDEYCYSLPFGNNIGNTRQTNCQGPGVDATEHHFTGKERDTESGNDYFEARYYSSSMGRFMSPDWSAKEEPVPYAVLTDPQSLNLYSYVGNNPLAKADADGHCWPVCDLIASVSIAVGNYVGSHPGVQQALNKLGDSLGLKVSAGLGRSVNVGGVKLGAAVNVTSETRIDGTGSSGVQGTLSGRVGDVGGQLNGTATFEKNGSLVNPLNNLSGNLKGTTSTAHSDASNSTTNTAIGTDDRVSVGVGVNVGVAQAGVAVTAGTQEATGVLRSVGDAAAQDTRQYVKDLKTSTTCTVGGCAH
jgi:RHS repeat-associated protein